MAEEAIGPEPRRRASTDGPVEIRRLCEEQEEVEFRRLRLRELAEAIGLRESELERARQRVESSREALVEASRAVEVLDKHYEGWCREIRRRQQRREQRRRNEMSTSLWLRRNAEEAV